MSNNTDPESPTSFNTPGRTMFDDTDTSSLGMAIMTLTKELWLQADRLRILEAVLEKKGIDVSQEIDEFEPDEELQKELSEKGVAMLEKVLHALKS